MRDDGIRKGGPRDPVAKSIRNEQARDSVPSEGEREEIAREANTCDECGEHLPDEVRVRAFDDYTDDCDARQHRADVAHEAPPRLCDGCAPEVETKQDIIEQHLLEGDDYVVEYGCGVLEQVDRGMRLGGSPPPHPGWSPDISIEHRCGETIEHVWTADEVFDDE